MTVLQFIAEMTKALAWPAVVLVCVTVFYRALKDRIPDLQSFKLPGGVQFDFSKAVGQVAAEVEQLPPLPAAGEQPESPAVVPITPSHRIIHAWLQVEAELEQLAEIVPLKGQSAGRWISELTDARLINSKVADVLNELRQLRSRAAHEETSIHEAAAAVYENTAREMVDRLAFVAASVLHMREPGRDTRQF